MLDCCARNKKLWLLGLCFVSIMVLVVAVPSAQAGLESWTFIDGNGTTGVNYDTSLDAIEATTAVLNGDLYVAWTQVTPGYSGGLIRVKRYHNSSWEAIDGSGLNYNIAKVAWRPNMAVYNNQIYIVWQEYNDSSSGDIIHCRKYNGSTWDWADDLVSDAFGSSQRTPPCLNWCCTAPAADPALGVYNSKLYAAWVENKNGNIRQVRVSRYDGGQEWILVDGNGELGLNINSANTTYNPTLAAYNGFLYVAWVEWDGSTQQLRIKKYNGTNWSSADGGTMQNYDGKSAYNPVFQAANGELYLSWYQTNTSTAYPNIRLKKLSGDSWVFLDGEGVAGITHAAANGYASTPAMAEGTNRLYLAWEDWENDDSTGTNIRVSQYIGSDLNYLDGDGVIGLNKNTATSASNVSLAFDGSFLYAAWEEGQGKLSTLLEPKQVRVRRMAIPQSVAVGVASFNPAAGADNLITLTVSNALGTDTSFSGTHSITVSGYSAAPDGSFGKFNNALLSAAPNNIDVVFTNGVATANLVLNNANSQNIVFSMAELVSPNSNTLAIQPQPGLPGAMILTQDVSNTIMTGQAFNPSLRITLKDNYQNICTNDSNTKITASKNDTGPWNLTGTNPVTVSAGVASFSDLGVNSAVAVSNAQLKFTCDGLNDIASSLFNLIIPASIKTTNPSVLTEATANDGSLSSGTVVVTIADGTLANPLVKAEVSSSNLPAELDYTVNRDSDTQLTINIAGQATNHANANDVSNLTFTIAQAKVTGASGNLTTPDISIDFNDPAAIVSTNPTCLTEASTNDGSLISGTIAVTIANGTLLDGVSTDNVTASNLPSGFSYTPTKTNDTTLTIAITGKADNHADADDVDNITFTIDKAIIVGAEANLTTVPIAIDFNDLPPVSATISPDTARFDKKPVKQTDVTTTITWNNGVELLDITAGGNSIGTESYSVDGTTLTIKKEYLATQATGSLALSLEFRKGDAATLTIDIIDTSTEGPDLAFVSDITLSLTSLTPGGKVKTAYNVINQGTQTSNNCVLKIYLLNKADDEPASGVLLGQANISKLKSTKVKKGSVNCKIPGDLRWEQGYIKAIIDADEAVEETIETNNTSISASMPVLYPDLAFVANSVLMPATAKAGAKITVQDSVINQGSAAAAKFTVNYYLWDGSSPDSKTVLLTSRKISSLKVNKTSAKKTRLTIPANLAPGTWYLWAEIDEAGTIYESNGESNNCSNRDASITTT